MVKPISEKNALIQLTRITSKLRDHVTAEYEHRAKSCATCDTPGACCLDAHFVNVRTSGLEAVRINSMLSEMSAERRLEVERRIDRAIERYDLANESTAVDAKFVCPLYEPGAGCL